MATLKLCIVPAKVLINGKHKVRISLAHNSGTRYIPTNCIIDDLSQFKDGQVVNHPEAASMNMKLRNLLNHYQKVIDNIYDVDVYSCSELREIIIKKKAKKFIDSLPVNERRRVVAAIELLPNGEDIKKLKGHDKLLRLRVGEYRIIYTVDNGELIVYVIDAGSRGQIYNRY